MFFSTVCFQRAKAQPLPSRLARGQRKGNKIRKFLQAFEIKRDFRQRLAAWNRRSGELAIKTVNLVNSGERGMVGLSDPNAVDLYDSLVCWGGANLLLEKLISPG